MTSFLLKAANIHKIFHKDAKSFDVLKGIDLQVSVGEKVSIVGPSGVGKSTLLHILGALEPPSSGSVFFEGQNVFAASEKQLAYFRNRNLGFVFQFHYLLSEFSALENVMMPALIAGIHYQEAQKYAKELLKFVGLEHRYQHRPFELSGGEQQRVAIARGVILRPKLLLADEPTGNLDSYHKGLIVDLLLRLNHVTKVSILLVTHDMELASKMDTMYTMRDGVFI